MDDKKPLDATTREGIDACRPGSDDLRRPEFPELALVAREISQNPFAADQFERVQRCDASLRSAMYDLPVPAGLAERILAQLGPTHVDIPQEAVDCVTLAKSPIPLSRRRWAWISLALAASVLIVGAGIVLWSFRARGPLDVVTLAEVWYPNLSGDWQPMSKVPRGSAIPNGLAVRPLRWQRMQAVQGYRGIAYDLTRPGRPPAVLFVVQVAPGGKLPNTPPLTPQSSSGGRVIAAWLSGKHTMCVLVVDGDDRAYQSLIRASQPLA